MIQEILNFPATPEIFLLAMTCVVLLADLFINKNKPIIIYLLSQFALIGSLLLVAQLAKVAETTIFYGTFIWDPTAHILKMMILAMSYFVFVYVRDYIEERKIPLGEYYVL